LRVSTGVGLWFVAWLRSSVRIVTSIEGCCHGLNGGSEKAVLESCRSPDEAWRRSPRSYTSVWHSTDVSKYWDAPDAQTVYLEAKTRRSDPSCDGAGIQMCTGCKQRRHCGQQRQLAHWPAHKAECNGAVEHNAVKGCYCSVACREFLSNLARGILVAWNSICTFGCSCRIIHRHCAEEGGRSFFECFKPINRRLFRHAGHAMDPGCKCRTSRPLLASELTSGMKLPVKLSISHLYAAQAMTSHLF
jgi:hypothetical protein